MLRRDFLNKRRPHSLTLKLRLRSGGAKRKLLIFLALVAAVVALLPTIIAKTPLRNSLLSAVVPGNAVHVSIGSASLSWISGPALSGVQVNDSAGNPLLTADSITIDRTPLNLLTNMHDCGVVAINRPQIFLKLRSDGSNVEDALQQLLAEITKNAKPPAEQPTAHAPFAYAIQIVDGTVNIEDATTGRASRIDGVNVQYDCHGAGGGLGNGSLAGQLVVPGPNGAPIPAGHFALTLKPNGNRNELALQAEAIALTTLQPFLNRFAPGTQLGGTLAGNGAATWTADANTVSDFATTGTFAVDQLEAASPRLKGDHVRIARLDLPWRISTQAAGLTIESLDLKCDVAQMAVRGRIDPAILSLSQNVTPAAMTAFALNANNDIELKGAVDAARLAAMLPHMLHVRSGTTITSGAIQLAGRIQPSREWPIVNRVGPRRPNQRDDGRQAVPLGSARHR